MNTILDSRYIGTYTASPASRPSIPIHYSNPVYSKMSPRYGALGATFQLSRLFQACSLIAIIGMTAKFISVIINSNATPPNILIGIISVVSPTLLQYTTPYFLQPIIPLSKSSIPLIIPTTDLHCSNLLHHHRNPVHRRHPPIPTLRSA